MSENEIAEIKKKMEEHEERILRLEGLFQDKPETPKKKISINEFILSKKPNNDIQKTLAIGYYCEKHDGLSSFNAKDLKSGFKASKVGKSPPNINYTAIMNIKKGHMTEAKEKKDNFKAWVLTETGEKYVENGFKSEE